jgi:hypothetical protein
MTVLLFSYIVNYKPKVQTLPLYTFSAIILIEILADEVGNCIVFYITFR